MLSAELAASASSDRGGGEQDVMMAAEASTRLERGGFIQPALLELPMPLQRRPVHRSRRLYSPLILNSGLRKEYNTTPGVDAAAKNDDVTTANATAKQQHAESHLDGKSYGNITTETSGKSLLLSETPLNKIKVKAVAGKIIAANFRMCHSTAITASLPH